MAMLNAIVLFLVFLFVVVAAAIIVIIAAVAATTAIAATRLCLHAPQHNSKEPETKKHGKAPDASCPKPRSMKHSIPCYAFADPELPAGPTLARALIRPPKTRKLSHS